MDLVEDQIVGFDKYPVSHRGMAYGARRTPSFGRAEKASGTPSSRFHGGRTRVNGTLPPATLPGRRERARPRQRPTARAEWWTC